jgi:hypothetical protein
LPGAYRTVRGPLVIHSDFPLPAEDRLIGDLAARRDEVCRQLQLPASDAPIDVYLFATAATFDSFVRVHFPTLPRRRAYFIESDTQLAVYAQWGDRVAVDLRHETTHAYLHAIVPNVPLWLDEGLAKYFEGPPEALGIVPDYAVWLRERLVDAAWRPDLARLEALEPKAGMNFEGYAESWAWTHLLLCGRAENRDLLCRYLADLRSDRTAAPVSARLQRADGDPTWTFLRHAQELVAASSPHR